MSFLSLRILLPLAGALAAASLGVAPSRAAASEPVASLDPAATAKLWHEVVARRRTARVADDCRPLTAVFYAATDWLRLATHLAAAPSPCAQYYISVPPLAADHTRLRVGQAEQIRALGPNFHVLAEINYTGWSRWVADTGAGWFAAGVEARRRMAATGYDVNAGDTWALNELSSAVRQGNGDARQDARDFIRGLFTGGEGPAVRGVVFTVGIAQTGGALDLYQARLQDWLEDGAFWSEVAGYVSDWSQELYGDVPAYGVPGTSAQQRRDFLNDYLGHVLTLARAGPDSAQAARAFLESAYSPLANAAWQYNSEFGITNVPYDLMEQFVSAQVYAMRAFGANRVEDRFGLAWAPRNGSGLAAADFRNQTNALLDRLAQAIRDSGQPLDPNDPGVGACGPIGQNQWCGGDLAGAAFTSAWKPLATWQPEQLVITTPPQIVQPGVPSGAIAVELRTAAGRTLTATQGLGVTLTTSSPTGGFSTSPSGPFTSSLGVTISPGSATASFYYLDPEAGSPVLSAGATDKTSGTQTETIGTPPPSGPDTTLTAAPTGTVRSSSASFSFTASVSGASFECSLDGSAFVQCTSPATYAGLPDGSHTFAVRAADGAGNVDAMPAQTTWTSDTTPPQTTIASAPRGTAAATTARVAFSADERASFQCSLDSRAFSACQSPLSLRDLRQGTHTFAVRGIDTAGNVEPDPAAVSWSVDTTPPQTTIARAPRRVVASAAASVWFKANERGSTFQCSIDGAAFAACRSPLRLKGLRDLRHTVRIRAVDLAGNVDPSPGQAIWTSDTTPPLTRVAKAPPRLIASRALTAWVATNERGARLQCSLDGSAFARCTSPLRFQTHGDGRHRLRVRAIDVAGNVDRSPAVISWTSDLTPPDTRIVQGPARATSARKATFWLAASERRSRFQCSLDAHAFASCRSPQRYAALAPGTHRLRVRAVDSVGNADRTPAAYSWQIR